MADLISNGTVVTFKQVEFTMFSINI
jgi:hypothetical protein